MDHRLAAAPDISGTPKSCRRLSEYPTLTEHAGTTAVCEFWCCNGLVTESRHVDVGAVDLYGLIEELVRSEPRKPETAATPGAGTARSHDALAAVARLARAIETPAQAGDLDPEQAHRMASLLLVIRDYIEPVSPVADERVSRYLADVVDKLHR